MITLQCIDPALYYAETLMRKLPVAARPENIIQAIGRKLLPWAERDDAPRPVVAQATFQQFMAATGKLPTGVRVSRTRLRGPRIGTKGSGLNNAGNIVSARWPEAGMEVKRVAMLICVLDGEVDWPVSDYTLHCGPGQIILVPPDVPSPDGMHPHLDQARRHDGHCDLIWFRPAFDWLTCAMCHSRGERHWKSLEDLCDVRHRQISTYFDDYVQEVQNRHADRERVSQCLLIAFLSVLRRELESGNSVLLMPQKPLPLSPQDKNDPMQRAQHYMCSHLAEPLTMEQVARSVYMSRALFARRFTGATGQTFVEYLTLLRLEEAKKLLRETNWALINVCSYVGVKPTRLTEIFNRHTGMSPGAYRQQHRPTIDDSDFP